MLVVRIVFELFPILWVLITMSFAGVLVTGVAVASRAR